MGTALRPGGLYRSPDGTWHDANGYQVAGPSAAEKKTATDYANTLWERDQLLQAAGTQRVIMREAGPPAERPAERDIDDFEPTDAALSAPTFAPAGEPDADLDLTGDEQQQIQAIKQAARERMQAEAEESAKALAARREEVRQEAIEANQRSVAMAGKTPRTTTQTGTQTKTPTTTGTQTGGQAGTSTPPATATPAPTTTGTSGTSGGQSTSTSTTPSKSGSGTSGGQSKGGA